MLWFSSILVAILDDKSCMVILSCLYDSEMLLLKLLICKSKMPLTDILQDNEHLIHGYTSICDLNFKLTAVDIKILFLLNIFNRKIFGIYLCILYFLCFCVN